MEPIDYPEITVLTVEEAKNSSFPKMSLNPDWVTKILFEYQNNSENPPIVFVPELFVVSIAQAIKPRSEWGITTEQVEQAMVRRRK